MALTRVQRGMINQPAPIRWTGSESDRLALTPSDVLSIDVNYFFYQNGGTLFRLVSIGNDALVWEGIKGAGLEGGINISTVTGLQDALDAKVNLADLDTTNGPITVTTTPADPGTDTPASTTISVRDATDVVKGVVKLASAEEITAGTSTTSVVTVAQLNDVKTNAFARADLTNSDGTIVLDKTGAGNSIVISAAPATDTQAGVVEVATDAEVTAGTSTSTVMTTKQVMDEVAKALMKDFAALTAVTANDGVLADTDLIAIRSGSDNFKVTASELKNYVINEIQQAKLFKGYFATDTALTNAWSGADVDHTPEAGSFAIVESTDSVWIWNSDRTIPDTENEGQTIPAPQWEDTRSTGTVNANTQVIAGTGLTGGGALASDVTLNVTYGTTAGTACEGNDARLSRTPVVWTGDSSAFSSVTPEDWHEGFLYVVTGLASDSFDRRVYECVDYDAADRANMFVLLGEDQKVKQVKTYSGSLTSGTNTITLEAMDENSFLEVYLTGIRQGEGAFSVAYSSNDTVITLSENVSTDIAYTVVVFPLTKPATV